MLLCEVVSSYHSSCNIIVLLESSFCILCLGGCEKETWKPLLSRHVLKTLRGSPNRTISASGRIELLQMVTEPDTSRYASEDVGSRRVGGL